MSSAEEIVNSIRAAVLARGGANGIRSLGRSFRIMDDDGSKALSAAEFLTGMQDYGIDLSPSEATAVIDAYGQDGIITITNFLRMIRGTLNKKRTAIVEKAWTKLDRDGSGVATVEDLQTVFSAKRNPAVLRGEKTENQVIEEFLTTFDDQTNPDGRVTKDEFLDYYAGLSSSVDHDDEFVLIVNRAWKIDQPNINISEQQLKAKVAEGFKTSSSYGRNDAVNREPVVIADGNDQSKGDPQRRKWNLAVAPMKDSVNPYPTVKMGNVPKGKQGAYNVTTSMHHKTSSLNEASSLTMGGTVKFEGEKSTTGRVPNGLHDSRGFLTSTTASHDATAHATFDDGVMEAFKAGKEKEAAIAAHRQQLLSTPYETPEPRMYLPTSRTHCNLMPAMEGSSAVSLNKARPRGNVTPMPPVARPKTNVTTQELMQKLQEEREKQKPQVGLGNTGRASSWSTTSKTAFQAIDYAEVDCLNDRFASAPPHRVESEELQKFIEESDKRAAQKYTGDYETTSAAKLQDRFKESTPTQHRHRGIFELHGGAVQMIPQFHHPRETKVGLGETFGVSQINTQQFETTAGSMQKIPKLMKSQ